MDEAEVTFETLLAQRGFIWILRKLTIVAFDMRARATDKINSAAWATIHGRLVDAYVIASRTTDQ